MNNLYLLAYYFKLRVILDDKIDNLGNGLIYMLSIIAYAAYAQGCQLPQVMVIYFGYRDIILITESGYDGLNYSSFVFEGLVLRYMQFYLTYASVHLLTNLKRV
jgi:hypothetical protein